MKLSIVVLNYKSKNLIKYLLKRALSFKLPWHWEIIVVDNDSRDKIGELIDLNFPVVKFIQSKRNIGMGGGNNLGIKESHGEYILIANPDITLNEKAVIEMVDFLDKNERAGVAGPRILNPDKTIQETCFRWPNFFTFLYRRTFLGRTKKGRESLYYFSYQDIDLSQNRQVDWVLGGCLMIRAKALQDTGVFDDRFFLFLEDTDLCRRMWQKDWQVWYLAKAEVIHLPHRLSQNEGSLGSFFSKLTWVHLSSWAKYFWKWRSK
ncbi:MAG: glycosyltransferase family 2 protein [Candidatus Kuenenbacteria bacterium]